jgi:hypothetical protein
MTLKDLPEANQLAQELRSWKGRWIFRFWRWGCRVHVFGHGFYIGMDRPVYFSERYGHERVRRFGRWALIFV